MPGKGEGVIPGRDRVSAQCIVAVDDDARWLGGRRRRGIAPVLPPLRFARLRAQFHILFELDLAQRAGALRDIEVADARLAAELHALMATLDEAVLLAAPAV